MILEANLTAATMLRVARGGLIKQRLALFILLEDQDIYYRHLKKLFETREPQTCELRMLRADADPIWVRVDSTVVQEAGGASVYRAVMSDITERKRAEEERAQLQAAIRCIAERKLAEQAFMLANVSDAVIGFDLDFQISFWGESAERMFGYSAAEAVGKSGFDMLRTTYVETSREDVRRRLSEHGYLEVESIEYTKDGRAINIESRAQVLRDDRGEPVGIVAVSRDITDRKQAEEALRKAHTELKDHARRLEETNRELEGFTYTISHDLRAPLRAINGFAHMLTDDYGPSLDEEGKRRLAVIETSAVKMGLLIDDLLAFSHAGRKAMNVTRIDMNKLVTDVVAILKTSDEGVKGDIQVSPLPPAQGDPAIIRQVLTNLLENAVKFSRKRPDPRVEVGSFERESEQVYFVKDNGVGFDMKYYDKLFGIFQRLVTEKEFKGTGVGLAIVRRLVSRYGGRVWAEGKVNEGATFYFTLPAKDRQSKQTS